MNTRSSRRWWSAVALSGVILSAWMAIAAQESGNTADTIVTVDAAALLDARNSGSNWLTYGRDYSETRYSPLTQITPSNVGSLELAWTHTVGTGGGGQEATPLVWNGVLYSITNWSIVFAVDARTGEELWRWDPQVDRQATQPRICCGVVNRGIALYDGKILTPVIDGRLAALDARTGNPIWEVMTVPEDQMYTITMAPRVVKGKVIVGNSGGEFGVRGYFSAYDIQTGEMAWRFYTVPGNPAEPFERPDLEAAAATWTGEWWTMGGGGTVWDAIAYDPEADLLYVGTGNGSPWVRDYRSPGGGDNLYLASILAVRPDTGQYVWHYQTTPGDHWDYTAVQHLLLADLVIDGRLRKVIMQAPKNGFFYVLDRFTGEFISAQPIANVSWALGIDQRTGRPIENPEARYGMAGITISPGPGGAHNWAPMSFSPATGLVYIPANTTSSYYYRPQPDFEFRPGQFNTGTCLFVQCPPATETAPPQPPIIGPESPAGQRGGGYLLAWDPVTQQERWRQPGGGSIGGGALTTATNIVFQVTPDGRLLAYQADDGTRLLEIQSGGGGGMGPPITYEIDGRQYVSFMGGQGQRGGGPPPVPGQTAPAGTPTGPPPPRVFTYTLPAATN